MRFLVMVGVLGGCTENTSVEITSSANFVGVSILDADCTCARANGCTTWSDVGNEPPPCSCASSCDDALLELVRDGEVFGATIDNRKGWVGDFGGWTLVVRGCGGEMMYPIPTTNPEPPRIVGGTMTSVEWEAPSGTSQVTASTAPGFAGTRCRFDGTATRADLQGAGAPPFTVTAKVPLEPFSSSIGLVYPSQTSEAEFDPREAP